MSERGQMTTLAVNNLKRIIIWSSCLDSPQLHATDDSRQGKEEEATENERTSSQIRSRYGFLRRIRVRSGLAKTPVVPTAQSAPPGVAVIPCRRLLEFWLLGLCTKFHCEPFQFSVNVNWALPWIGTIYWPAVQMLLLDKATTPTNTGFVASGLKI